MSDWLKEIAAEPYEHRGILHSEIVALISACRHFGIQAIIESGRARAQSTYLLAKYMPDIRIHSIDWASNGNEDIAFGKRRLAGFENVTLYDGDGRQGIAQLAEIIKPVRTAVLCDGPKHSEAINVVVKCFELNPHVKLGFIHDMKILDRGRPIHLRQEAMERLPVSWFSDDPEFVDMVKWVDANVVAVGGPCGPHWQALYGTYGPTLGVFANQSLPVSWRDVVYPRVSP